MDSTLCKDCETNPKMVFKNGKLNTYCKSCFSKRCKQSRQKTSKYKEYLERYRREHAAEIKNQRHEYYLRRKNALKIDTEGCSLTADNGLVCAL